MPTSVPGKAVLTLAVLSALLTVLGCSAARRLPRESSGESAQAAGPHGEEPGETAQAPSEQPAGPKEESGELTEAEYKELESVGRDIMLAHSLYQDYFTKRAADGTKNMTVLNRAIAMLGQLMPRIEALIDKYPDSPVVQEYFKTANEDYRALMFEQE